MSIYTVHNSCEAIIVITVMMTVQSHALEADVHFDLERIDAQESLLYKTAHTGFCGLNSLQSYMTRPMMT